MRTLILITLLTGFFFAQAVNAEDSLPMNDLFVSSSDRELLRQWLGNHMHADHAGGDWSGGLTIYLSDHLREEREGNGWLYRKNLLVHYENYVKAEKEFPLKDFTDGKDPALTAAGRGKGAMVFHMLKNLTGDDVFYSAVSGLIREKAFQKASWADLQRAFEKASGMNLDWFFSQWVGRKGIPSLEIRDPMVSVVRGMRTVSFEIIQTGEPYRLDLPLRIETDQGEITETLHIEREREAFEIPVQGTPLKIIFDGEYDILRKLSYEEHPPVISALLGDEKRLAVIPEEEREKYTGLTDSLKEEGFIFKEEGEIRDEDIRTHSLLVPGYDNTVLRRLFGRIEKPDAGFSLEVRKNPLNTAKVVAIAYAGSKGEVPLAQEIFRYADYSSVRFENRMIVGKKTAETEQGISFDLSEPVMVIQPKKTRKLEEIIKGIIDKPVIYVGERHTNYEDHKVQLKVIMSLHEKGRKFAIGMEMFQRPFQKVIDDYLTGTALSEREFLKRTEYFKRWQFDYTLYREIIEYAKANNIPVIALNLWSEIIKKVSAEGLDGLSDFEKAELPNSMDMSDGDYRKRLEEIFKMHKKHEKKNFEYFFQSQILWDETMAHSIDDFLKKKPDYQIVVLAGAGHIMYGSGIPKRAHRRNGREYVTIMPAAESMDEDLGDYLFSAEPVFPPMTLKLGVMLKEKDGRVCVDSIVPGSIAKSAGLKKGDILLSLDDWKVEDIADVNIFMSDRKRGDAVTIRILRKGFLTGYRELTLTGTI